MRILIITSFSFEKYGGAGVVVDNLMKEYRKHGHETEIISLESFGFGKFGRFFGQFFDVFNPKAVNFLKKEVKKTKPDFVHIHNVHKNISAFSVRSIALTGTPVIVTLHEFWALCPGFNFENGRNEKIICRKTMTKELPVFFRNFLIRKFLSYADYIFVPSDFARNKFLEYGYSKDKVKRIYNGVDLKKFTPEKEKKMSEKIKIIFVGRPTKKKGVEWLKEVFNKLKSEKLPVELEIIGGENEVKYDELPKHYQDADVCVQPSLVHETFGLTLVEAMACGLPVIASNMGGMPEILGDDGVVVKPGDFGELESALKDLILSAEKRMILGRKGRDRVEKKFSWEMAGKEYLKFIENIVSQKNT